MEHPYGMPKQTGAGKKSPMGGATISTPANFLSARESHFFAPHASADVLWTMCAVCLCALVPMCDPGPWLV